MTSYPILFRVIALLLLVSAALCWAGDIEDDFSRAEQSSTQSDCSDTGAGGDCFCCCAHVIPTRATGWLMVVGTTYLQPPAMLTVADPPLVDIFQPPRA